MVILVAMAMRYFVDNYHPEEPPSQIWTQYGIRQRYHCGCYGNLVTIVTKYVAGVHHPIEPPYQIWTYSDLIFTHKKFISLKL